MADQQRLIQIVVDSKSSESAVKQLTREVNKLETQLLKVKSPTKAANDNIGNVGRSAGQAGIQIQQFVGQVQGGQSAMLALSQQSADLGFVLGAPLLGAVVGITASLAGMLLPTLFKTADAMKEIDETADTLTGNFLQLNEQQQAIAREALAAKILTQKKAITELDEALKDANETLADRERHIAGGGLEFSAFSVAEAEKEVTQIQASIVVADIELQKLNKTLSSLGTGQLKAIQSDLDKIGQGLTGFMDKTQTQQNPFTVNIDTLKANRAEALMAINAAELTALENTKLTEDQKSAIVSEATFNRVSLEMLANQEKIAALKRDEDAFNQYKLDAAASVGSSIMSIAQGQSKGLFKIGKALSLASAIASLPTAVMKSYENAGGYPWGIPAAAAMTATGLAQIARIKNTKFGSSNASGSSSSGGATTTPAANDATFAPTTQTQSTERTSQNEILNELRKWNGSAFIPIEVARGIAQSLVTVEQQGGI